MELRRVIKDILKENEEIIIPFPKWLLGSSGKHHIEAAS